MIERNSYDVILIDCPWEYNDKASAGNRGAGFKYPQLNMTDLIQLNIRLLAKTNAVVFSWITPPLMREGLQVMESWGAKYKTKAFTWIKLDKAGNPRIMGGNHTRANSEDCILGVFGKGVKRANAGVRQPILSVPGRHSEKPVEAYERIEALYGPDVRRIELFARKPRDGWDSLGIDVGTGDIRDNLAMLQLGLDPVLAGGDKVFCIGKSWDRLTSTNKIPARFSIEGHVKDDLVKRLGDIPAVFPSSDLNPLSDNFVYNELDSGDLNKLHEAD